MPAVTRPWIIRWIEDDLEDEWSQDTEDHPQDPRLPDVPPVDDRIG